jgi:hypothetical protein
MDNNTTTRKSSGKKGGWHEYQQQQQVGVGGHVRDTMGSDTHAWYQVNNKSRHGATWRVGVPFCQASSCWVFLPSWSRLLVASSNVYTKPSQTNNKVKQNQVSMHQSAYMNHGKTCTFVVPFPPFSLDDKQSR